MPRRQKTFWVYVLASDRNGTLYIGVTNDIIRRICQHKGGLVPGFTKRYGVTKLVHVEPFESVSYAIQREKSLKKWPRKWKLDLIERATTPNGAISRRSRFGESVRVAPGSPGQARR